MPRTVSDCLLGPESQGNGASTDESAENDGGRMQEEFSGDLKLVICCFELSSTGSFGLFVSGDAIKF